MTIEELQELYGQFHGVTEDIKREQDLCFCVGGKMVLAVGVGQGQPTASFKTLPGMCNGP